jgi:hypothetical protein
MLIFDVDVRQVGLQAQLKLWQCGDMERTIQQGASAMPFKDRTDGMEAQRGRVAPTVVVADPGDGQKRSLCTSSGASLALNRR